MIKFLILFLITGLIVISIFFLYRREWNSLNMFLQKTFNFFKNFHSILKNLFIKFKSSKKLLYRNKPKYDLISSKEIFESIKEIREYLSILTKNVSKKDEEIDRFKKGHDVKIFKNFLNRFLRVYKVVEEDIEFYTEKGNVEISKILNNIKSNLKEAFLDCELEEFQPQEGQTYKECFGLSEDIEHISTNDKTKDMKIVKVKRKGFKLKTYYGYEVIRPAIVSIYKYKERK